MELKRLDKQQVTYIYNEHMPEDFLKDEIKPLGMIFKAIDKGIYECLGAYDEGSLAGYAFLVRSGSDYLLDYFAIFANRRNEGIGSKTLQLLSEYIPDLSALVIEAENPEYADNLQDKEVQERRIGFYLRNGCRDTGVRVTCFGVPFVLLVLGSDRKEHKEEIKELYKSFYKDMLPPRMYRENVRIDD